ncbi:MAG: gamma-glutamyl-gamma-aminobutyrate hydrolase family protein [Chloroflexi bacterium]|nr:gamma-glutamyl-gamma-aminobutyrate hydrolase family protein [Chloroflexota bacterium]
MTRPLIGIPTATTLTEHYWARVVYDVVAAYSRAVDRNGGVPMLIPLNLSDEALRTLYDRVDGVLLAGGDDMHPATYGESAQPHCGAPDSLRDATELKIARWALDERKPLLGICRGLQMINVATGGTLYQDVDTEYPDPIQHRIRGANGMPINAPHPIAIDEGSRLAKAIGATTAIVNSGHHQAVKDVGDGLQVIARAADQLVEAVTAVADERYILAVQFHPELMIDDEPRMNGIFRDFVNACSAEAR